ncbi:GcrA cell cycle regulator [Rhodoblastus acidophilus]|uniref:GcrA family cell cycle regulator n=1 Tax=Rhodoblastus acidophilus TaxID=1074 RepID=UPI002224809D|nr:GcrA family cell cycle regulator [Rhodoblastus acidophilus]MCW2317226.1 GcrA cell cycle regulator [Rhodoblastus acidophilus]
MGKKHDDAARAMLKRLIDEGFSAAQVAASTDLGSRNAVIGLAFRLGLRFSSRPKNTAPRKDRIEAATRPPSPQNAAAPCSGPEEPARAGAAMKAAPVTNSEVEEARPSAPVVAISQQLTRPSSVSVIDPPEDGRFQLWHLTERMCHFPLGDPRNEDFRFCGAAKPVEGGPYCADHAQLAYTAARSDTREARRERGKMRFYEFTKVLAVV